MYKEVRLTNGLVAKVDADKYDEVSQISWHQDDAGYARSNVWEGGRKIAAPRMHRAILTGIDVKLHIDHINGDRLDNRTENLRVCTASQNTMNRGAQANNTSGYKGVIYDKQRQKWRAEICYGGKRRYLGRFNSAEEVALAYNEAARIHHGDFAFQNAI